MDRLAIAYDLAIALVIGGVPVLLAHAWRSPHRGSAFPLALLLVPLWLVIAYGSFIEPKLLTMRSYDVRIGDGKDTMRIAVISDTHLGSFKHGDWAEKLVRKINAASPDVVLLAGDLATVPAGTGSFGPFKGLRAKYGAFAVLGNWDYAAGAVDVRRAIESTGIEVLTNESVPIKIGNREVRLVGLDDYLYGRPDWEEALSQAPAGTARIVVVHNPDFAPQGELRGVDLMIAGHTHCGQVRLPVIGAVPDIPDHLGRRFDCGLFDYGPMKLFITKGVGESGTRARLFDRPEVSILRVLF